MKRKNGESTKPRDASTRRLDPELPRSGHAVVANIVNDVCASDELAAPADGGTVVSDEADIAATIAVPEGFRVDDAAKASWVVRKVLEARAYALRVKQWAEQELRRADRENAWLMRRFGPELEAWLRAELGARGGQRRSVALPAGSVGLRRQPSKLEVVDERAVAAWAESHLPDSLRVIVEAEGAMARELAQWQRLHEDDSRVRKQVLREPLNRYVAECGELPDGATLSGSEDHLYVK